MPDTGLRYGENITDGKVTTEQVIAFVREANAYALEEHGSIYRQVPMWYNFYCGNGAGDFPSYRNNVHIPFALSYIQTGVGHKVQSTFGANPSFDFESPSGNDAYAQQAAAVLQEQLRDIGIFGKAIDFYTSAEIYGTGFFQTGWKNITRPRYIRHRYMGQEQIIVDPAYEYFDGNDLQVLDILDTRPCPGYAPAQNCPWVVIRYWEDFDNMWEQANGPYPKWDLAGLRKLKESPMYTTTIDEWNRRSGHYRSFSDAQQRQGQRYARPVEIIEFRGLAPREFGVKGDRNVIISIANGTTLVRYEGNCLFHGHHGVWSYAPLRDPHSIWGIGKIKLILPMQAAANKLINSQLDALELFGMPQFLAGTGVAFDRENLTTKPGRVHRVEGDLAQFQPLIPDLSGTQFVSVELEQLSRYMQQGTGATDIVQGLPSSQDRTAREYLGLREQAMGRLAVEALQAEKDMIEPMLDQLHTNNIQFLRLPKKVRMLGQRALQDFVTGMPIDMDRTVDIEAMNPDYRARAVGAMQMIGKSIRAQNLMTWAGLMGGNPIWMQLTNWVGLAKEIAQALDLRPESVLNTQLPMLNEFGMDQGAIDPEQMINQMANADTLPMLNPDQLGGQSSEPLAAFANGGY